MSPASVVPGNRSHELLHRKSGSFPGSLPGSSTTLGHVRTASEPSPPAGHTPPNPSHLKRASTQKYKGLAPPIQSPLSRYSEEEFPLRGPDYSPVDNEGASSSGHVSMDMTGVGVINMRGAGAIGQKDMLTNKNSAAGVSHEDTTLTQPNSTNRGERERVKTGELFYEAARGRAGAHADYHANSSTDSSSSPEPQVALTPRDSPDVTGGEQTKERADSTPFIMNPTVFRDSAFSSGSTQSMEIPIAWTGPERKKKGPAPEGYDPSTGRYVSSPGTDEGYMGESDGSERISQGSSFRVSTTPRFPGQWQPSPIDETPEHIGGLRLPEDVSPEGQNVHRPERKHVNAERVASPTIPTSPDASRQSEVAIYGMVSNSPPPNSPSPSPVRNSGAASSIRSEGWVLVNVAEDTGASSSSLGKPERRKSPPHSSLSPIAKAIAAEDASAPEPKALRKLLPNSLTKTRAEEGESDYKKKGRRPSIRERWRKKGSST